MIPSPTEALASAAREDLAAYALMQYRHFDFACHIQKIVSEAAAYNSANPEYGFFGDPLRPVAGKYYGYLIPAGSY